jgi:hypothetical protein
LAFGKKETTSKHSARSPFARTTLPLLYFRQSLSTNSIPFQGDDCQATAMSTSAPIPSHLPPPGYTTPSSRIPAAISTSLCIFKCEIWTELCPRFHTHQVNPARVPEISMNLILLHAFNRSPRLSIHVSHSTQEAIAFCRDVFLGRSLNARTINALFLRLGGETKGGEPLWVEIREEHWEQTMNEMPGWSGNGFMMLDARTLAAGESRPGRWSDWQ